MIKTVTKYTGENQSRQARHAERKALERNSIIIPPPVDLQRRRALLADPVAFLKYYFPDRFWSPFAPYQLEMMQLIVDVAEFGGDQAIAAPRGDGKTLSAPEEPAMRALAECAAGSTFRLTRVLDQSAGFLRYLTESGLALGTTGQVEKNPDGAGLMRIRVSRKPISLALDAAGKAELVDIVTAVANAETTLETVISLRDRVITAYQEIMRMPI